MIEDFGWWVRYYQVSEGRSKAMACLLVTYDLLRAGWGRLLCHWFNHQWEGHGWAGPESGGDGAHCLRCGESWDVTFY